jgi:ATP-dependent Clp protease ATP-binding subunit ClpC
MSKKRKSVGVAANAEATALGHNYLGTEHLILAIAGDVDSIAARALAAHGIRQEHLRTAITWFVQPGAGEQSHKPRTQTPRVKQAIEISISEARLLGERDMSLEHLLLGLLQVPEGVAYKAVCGLGGDPVAIRHKIIELLRESRV